MLQPEVKDKSRDEARLESWKAIAAYLQRNAVTARRWEKEEGLPVHRHVHKSRSSIYAYPSEIDAWRALRRIAPEPPPPIPMWKSLLEWPTAGAFAATILACVLMVGSGIRSASAESKPKGISLRQVCAGANCDGGISPDGRYLLFEVDGNLSIRDLTTGKVRPLTHLPAPLKMWASQSWSPDSKRIAYAASESGPGITSFKTAQTFLVNLDGTGTKTVYSGAAPWDWSPDGKRLLIEACPAENLRLCKLIWVTVADGAAQVLPTARRFIEPAVVSPDGKYIAFGASDKDLESELDVYVMASDGSAETLVFASPTYKGPVAWTPDGKYLLFAEWGSSWTLRAVPFSGGKPSGAPVVIKRDSGDNHTEFSGITHSGTIYYRTIGNADDLYTASMDPATGKVTSAPVQLPLPRSGHEVQAHWSPDGKRIVHSWEEPQSPFKELSIYSVDTGEDQRVASSVVVRGGFCWGADGASLLLNTVRPLDAKQSEPVRFNMGTGETTILFPGAASFIIRSCSGDQVADFANPWDNPERKDSSIKVRNLKTRAETEIRKPVTWGPFLSHDGRWILFREEVDKQSMALSIVSSEGGTARELKRLKGPAQFAPYRALGWSPDDQFVYFLSKPNSNAPFELFRVPAAGGTEESTGLKLPKIGDFEIAPAGKAILLSVGSQQREMWAMENFLPSK